MKRFKNYLLTKRIIPENRVPYYLEWVSKFYAFCDKEPGDDVSTGEVETYLRHLSKFCEEWQVKQAKEAIELFRFVGRRSDSPKGNRDMDSNDQTTMIYTHVAERNRLGVRSPLDL